MNVLTKTFLLLLAGCGLSQPSGPSVGGGFSDDLMAMSFDSQYAPVLSYACTPSEVAVVREMYMSVFATMDSGQIVPSDAALRQWEAQASQLSPRCRQQMESLGEMARMQSEADRRVEMERSAADL